MWNTVKNAEIICVFVVATVGFSCCQNDFFLVNKYEGDKYYCITNSNYALSWILEDTASSLNLVQESEFLPSSQRSWNVGCEEFEKYGWSCNESSADELVTDRRWEKMMVVEADYVEDNESHNSKFIFQHLAKTPNGDFNLFLSIRSKGHAHLFLCEGEHVTSNCYWFILQGFGGKYTVIRKCPNWTVPIKNNVPVQSPCNITRTNVTHSRDADTFLTNKKWNHFKLSKRGNKIALLHPNDKEIISYEDKDEKAYNVKNIIVHNKHTTGLWKIHKVEQFMSTQPHRTEFTDLIHAVNGRICISAFVKMCKLCKLHFDIRSADIYSQILGEQSYNQTSTWEEIRFFKTNIGTHSLALTITTVNEGDGKPYWFISDLKQCGYNEHRVIELNKRASCQLLSPETNIISVEHEVAYTSFTNWSECTENTVGRYCVPCKSFMNEDCGKLKICSNNNNNNNNNAVCSCSAGYQMDKSSKKCNQKCSSKNYGFQCQNKCSDYCSDCNNIDGTCRSCTEKYTGKKCDIPPLPRFKNPPLVSNIGYTDVDVEVNNFELTSHPGNSSYKYSIQYKRAEPINGIWILYKSIHDLETSHTLTINNLHPGVKYYIRSVVVSGDIIYEFDNKIPHVEFTTKCDVVTDEDFEVNSSSTTASLLILPKRQNKVCELKRIIVELQPRTEKFGYNFMKAGINLINLTPFTNFTVSILNRTPGSNNVLILHVTTTEGVPEKVRNLTIIETSNSVIELTWKKPDFLHGHFQNYVITYKATKHLGCDFPTSNSDKKEVFTDQNSKTLSGLDSYTEYLIYVQAANTKFQGPAQTIRANTFHSGNINLKEIPKIISTKTKSRSVNIQFSTVTCNTLRGPLQVTVTAICSADWCNETISSGSFSYIQTKSFTLSSLYPFMNYKLELAFCRETCTISQHTFNTAPEAPYAIKNSLVYSKNENSISIRWQQPFPPTGNLELYNIIFYYDNANKDSLNVSANSSCTLWPKYECCTLQNLKEKRNYVIELKAKNKELEQSGQLYVIRASTKIEPPEKPPNLNIHWTLQNDLLIKWGHPTEANGDIKHFVLRIVPSSADTKDILRRVMNVAENQYKPIYEYTINSTEIASSTSYKIVVKAYNGKDGYESFVNDISPPEIPLLEADPKIINMTNTSVELQIEKPINLETQTTYKLFLLMSDGISHSEKYPPELQKFTESFNIELNPFRVLYECNQATTTRQFVIGQNNTSSNNCKYNSHPPLIPGNSYNITVILANTYQNKSSYKVYPLDTFTFGELTSHPRDWNLLFLLLLLLIIPIAIVIYICYRVVNKKSIESARNIEDSEWKSVLIASFNNSNSISIPVTNFNDYVKTSIQNKNLELQYNRIIRNFENDYQEIEDNIFWEHIDINFASGHHIPNVYIICNVPKNISDFWTQIWNENVHHVILLDGTHLQQFRDIYWPKYGLNLATKHISVCCVYEEIFADHEYRRFTLTFQNETRLIHQLRFTGWYGLDLPHSLTFVKFFKKISKITLKRKSPILVHCSGGLEGAGFAVLCDMCLRTAKKDKVVDVFKHSQNLGELSLRLIKNQNFYQLVHLVVLECLLSLNLNAEIDVLDDQSNFSVVFEKESKKYLTYMADTMWIDHLQEDSKRESNVYFQVDTPRYEGEIFLKPYSPDEEVGSYLSCIDGVIIDEIICPKMYILTKQPEQNCFEQFWKLAIKMEVSTIISLNENHFFDSSLCKNNDGLQLYDNLVIKLLNVTHFKCYDCMTIQVHHTKERKNIKVFSFKNWYDVDVCPPNVTDFVEFCIETSSITTISNPTLVMCCDGSTASGLYLAISCDIENIKKENKSNICSSARLVRRYRHSFATKDEQIRFLCETAACYIQQSNLYEIC